MLPVGSVNQETINFISRIDKVKEPFGSFVLLAGNADVISGGIGRSHDIKLIFCGIHLSYEKLLLPNNYTPASSCFESKLCTAILRSLF
jgi:hypothetical protein